MIPPMMVRLTRVLDRAQAIGLRVLYVVAFTALFWTTVTYRGAKALLGAARRAVGFYPWDLTRWLRSAWKFTADASTAGEVRASIKRFNEAMGSPGAVDALRNDPLPSPVLWIARAFTAAHSRIRRGYLMACRAAFVSNLAGRRIWRVLTGTTLLIRLFARETAFHVKLWWSWSRGAKTTDELGVYLTTYLRNEPQMSAIGNMPLAEAIATYLRMTRSPDASPTPAQASSPESSPANVPPVTLSSLSYLVGADWADHRLN